MLIDLTFICCWGHYQLDSCDDNLNYGCIWGEERDEWEYVLKKKNLKPIFSPWHPAKARRGVINKRDDTVKRMGGKGNLRYLSVLNFAKNNIFLIVLMIIRLKKKRLAWKTETTAGGKTMTSLCDTVCSPTIITEPWLTDIGRII